MKGLEISRRFFEEWALPYVKEHHPNLAARIAAGIFETSQAIGADDELSRDHAWGPGFQLLLPDGDFRREGEAFEARMNSEAPEEWLGWQSTHTKSVSVESIDGFFERETEHLHPPSGWKIASHIESHLHFIKHGPVYHDPLGAFSERRKEFSVWPQAELEERIHECCWKMWHYGHYNFLQRTSRRNDGLVTLTGLGAFLDATMRLCVYLDADFAVYWKWLPFQFRRIGWASAIAEHADGITSSPDTGEQARHVQEIYRLADEELRARGTSMKEQVGPV